MRVGRALSFHASLQVLGWAFTHKSCIGLMPGVGLALPCTWGNATVTRCCLRDCEKNERPG